MIGLVGRHPVTISKLPMDFGVEVGESGAEDFVQLSRAGLVGRAARLRCVVDEVVGEQFIEHREIAASLHFFGVAANDRFCGFACVAGGHDMLQWVEGAALWSRATDFHAPPPAF
jgi:hypothetical protein